MVRGGHVEGVQRAHAPQRGNQVPLEIIKVVARPVADRIPVYFVTPHASKVLGRHLDTQRADVGRQCRRVRQRTQAFVALAALAGDVLEEGACELRGAIAVDETEGRQRGVLNRRMPC